MANYECAYRTNYFRVTDEAKYKKLISNLSGEDIECFEGNDRPNLHGFGGFGNIQYLDVKTVAEWTFENDQTGSKPVVVYTETEWGSKVWVPIPDQKPETVGTMYVVEVIEKDEQHEIHACYDKEDLEAEDDNMIAFYRELQKILPDKEAMILMESGNEKLRYVTGFATIVTNKEIRFLNLSDLAVKTAGEMLGTDFQTEMDY